jgi:DNA-binding NarL/FixJ family response regulator
VAAFAVLASCNVPTGVDCDPPHVVLRCLIVDDNEGFLAVAHRTLERDGLDVVGTATTVAGALREVDALRPDVVLIDIALGAESGFELTRRLVARYPDLRERIVLISTRDEEDVRDLVAASPAAGFLSKARLSARAVSELVAARHS